MKTLMQLINFIRSAPSTGNEVDLTRKAWLKFEDEHLTLNEANEVRYLFKKYNVSDQDQERLVEGILKIFVLKPL